MRASRPQALSFSWRDISPNFIFLCSVFGLVSYLLYIRPSKITVILFVVAGWLVSLCLHEFGHALAAFYGGDTEVIHRGYLTLDPMKYMHPILSLVLPVVFLLMGGLGLPGGAVYVNTQRLRSDAWRSFMSAAGPLGTLICLFLLWLPLRLGLPSWLGPAEFWAAWTFLALVEIIALVINLLPLPGIDGFGIMEPWLPPSWAERVQFIRPYSFMILFALFNIPGLSDLLWGAVFNLALELGLNFQLLQYGYDLFSLR